VRSGQTFNYAGTIVIIGDVNPGAEVIAEGDVIVWGKLRGVVHAGAAGNEDAVVGALILAPTQLRIGKQIARAPDDRRARHFPEVARVRDGHIVVEPWIGS
jgi:septum site-determining protein MinC